jgi:hypothetical protein
MARIYEWLPALDVGERVAGGRVDVGAGVVEDDVIASFQLRHRGRSGHVGLQRREGALAGPAGDAGAHAVALGTGVAASRTNLGGRDRGVNAIAIAEGLLVDGGVAAGPPHGDSHECRDDQDGHDTAHGLTDRGCIQLPALEVVVLAVPVCHRASFCAQGRPRQVTPSRAALRTGGSPATKPPPNSKFDGGSLVNGGESVRA